MSTYINESTGKFPDYSHSPAVLRKFIVYIRSRKNLSEKTVNGYFIDLRTFTRFLMIARGLVTNCSLNSYQEEFAKIDISSCPDAVLLEATTETIDEFLYYCATVLRNSPRTVSRKLSSLKAFYGYLAGRGNLLDKDPAAVLEGPSLRGKQQPIYLTLNESLKLLSSIHTESTSRDYCIISLFLNNGMRISELIGIDLDKINFENRVIKIHGKGNKDRSAYLNNATEAALLAYLEDREKYPKIIDKDALFISKRTGRRLSSRGVEKMVEKVLQNAGFENRGFSPHKFRHTAATLMYQSGTDLLELSEILGHGSVAVTEIYAHLNNATLADVVNHAPLANVMPPSQIDISYKG